jgi:hypothetical protein
MRYQVEQLGYFGLKGMGLFGHLQIDTKRLKKYLPSQRKRQAQGFNNPPPPELGMGFEISRRAVVLVN